MGSYTTSPVCLPPYKESPNPHSDVRQSEEIQIKVKCREEVVDAVTRDRQLLLLINGRRLLASFLQLLLTGCTVRHRMQVLPGMHLHVTPEDLPEIELFVTHMTGKASHLFVNRANVMDQVTRSPGAIAASVVRAGVALFPMHRLTVNSHGGLTC